MCARRILGVIITYLPNREKLTELIRSLSAQVDHCLIVDNTNDDSQTASKLLRGELQKDEKKRIDFLNMGQNAGIASAINQGISICLRDEFDFIYLSDQDSLPPPDMIRKLVAASEELTAAGVKVGPVGPQYYDSVTKQAFPFQVKYESDVFYTNVHPSPGETFVESIMLITSGMLIPRQCLLEVGYYFNEMFVDNVDVEWCFRVQAHGFRLYGIPTTQLVHSLGEEATSTWFFGFRRMTRYPPLRIYYRIRNYIYLTKLPWVPLYWKVKAARYYLAALYSHVLSGPNRLLYLRYGIKGIWHGFRNILGRYPDELAKIPLPDMDQYRPDSPKKPDIQNAAE